MVDSLMIHNFLCDLIGTNTGTIRYDERSRLMSVIDVMQAISGETIRESSLMLQSLRRNTPIDGLICCKLVDQRDDVLMGNVRTIIQILMHLPGPHGDKARRKLDEIIQRPPPPPPPSHTYSI